MFVSLCQHEILSILNSQPLEVWDFIRFFYSCSFPMLAPTTTKSSKECLYYCLKIAGTPAFAPNDKSLPLHPPVFHCFSIIELIGSLYISQRLIDSLILFVCEIIIFSKAWGGFHVCGHHCFCLPINAWSVEQSLQRRDIPRVREPTLRGKTLESSSCPRRRRWQNFSLRRIAF